MSDTLTPREGELPSAVREMLATQRLEGIRPTKLEVWLATQVATGAVPVDLAVAEALAAALQQDVPPDA